MMRKINERLANTKVLCKGCFPDMQGGNFLSLWVQMMWSRDNKPACLVNWMKGQRTSEELEIPPKNCPRILEFMVMLDETIDL